MEVLGLVTLFIFSIIPLVMIAIFMDTALKNLNQKLWDDLTTLEYSISVGWRLKGKINNLQRHVINIDDKLQEILKRCSTSLRYLNLRSLFTPGFRSPIILVSRNCVNIENICTSEFLWVTQSELYAMKKRCNNLKKLTISLIEAENEIKLADLLTATKSLKYFALKNRIYSNNLTGVYLKYLPTNIIQEINLTRCSAIVPQLFNEAMENFAILRKLTIESCNFIDNSVIDVIMKKKTLTKLHINNIPIKCADNFKRGIVNLEHLEELSLPDNCWLKDECLTNISLHCKQIKLLDVSLCIALTNRGIASIVNLKELEVLKINWLFRVNDESFRDLINLRVLMCYGCHQVRDNGVMRLIKLAPQLTKLNLSQCSITGSTIDTAIAVTNRRRNTVLEINIFDTQMNLSELMLLDRSPLLRIVNTDICESYSIFFDE